MPLDRKRVAQLRRDVSVDIEELSLLIDSADKGSCDDNIRRLLWLLAQKVAGLEQHFQQLLAFTEGRSGSAGVRNGKRG